MIRTWIPELRMFDPRKRMILSNSSPLFIWQLAVQADTVYEGAAILLSKQELSDETAQWSHESGNGAVGAIAGPQLPFGWQL